MNTTQTDAHHPKSRRSSRQAAEHSRKARAQNRGAETLKGVTANRRLLMVLDVLDAIARQRRKRSKFTAAQAHSYNTLERNGISLMRKLVASLTSSC